MIPAHRLDDSQYFVTRTKIEGTYQTPFNRTIKVFLLSVGHHTVHIAIYKNRDFLPLKDSRVSGNIAFAKIAAPEGPANYTNNCRLVYTR